MINAQELTKEIGRKIGAERERKGIEVATMASALGCSHDYVRRIERGSAFSAGHLVLAARALGISVEALAERDQE